MAANRVIILFLLILEQISQSLQQQLFLWPQPRIAVISPGGSLIDPSSFAISVPAGSRILRAAASRFKRRIFTEKWAPVSDTPSANMSSLTPLLALTIFVSDLEADLQHGVDESYKLIVAGSSNSSIHANTTWGALYALETFSQLVRFDSLQQKLLIPCGAVIEDRPLYPHRGILLDTSRNFFPVKRLLRTIQALADNKLNILHWHISDSHSFPLILESEPQLSTKGAYGPQFMYSPSDVKRIVEFARSRGVRVIPEIDSPGHTASWGSAYPEIVTCLGKLWWDPNIQTWNQRMAAEPGAGQLNPLHPTTYKVVKNVIDEVSSLFPDAFFHAGADEVAPACWNASEDIAHHVASGDGTMSSLLELYINRTYAMIRAHNKTVMYWEDILLDATVKVTSSLLPKDSTIIQTWNNGAINTKAVTSAGYRAVVSSSDFLYLDCGRGDFLLNDTRFDQANNSVTPAAFNITGEASQFNYGGTGGSWCAPYKTWQRIYDYDLAYGLEAAEAELVLGAEAALWSEMADAAVLDSLLWPRSAALAELTWSGNREESGKRKRTAEAGTRLAEWRERMVGRGVAAQPLMPRWCLRNLGMCNINI